LREFITQVIFNSSEKFTGHLYSVVIYVQTDSKTKKIVIRSKQRGKPGQSLDDLVYLRKIKILNKNTKFIKDITVTADNLIFTKDDEFAVVLKKSLIPLSGRFKDKHSFTVTGTLGESFYTAVYQNTKGIYTVAWPGQNDANLFDLTNDHLQRQRDFYNDKILLGVINIPHSNEVLSLVNLRRRHAPTHFGKIGGEWDSKIGSIVEPWRLSIWRWKLNKDTKELMLTGRGTFFRKILLPKTPTPGVITSSELWQALKSRQIR